jgi:hypothetical protein
MAVGTPIRRWLVEEYRFVANHPRFFVTFVTENFRVASGKWKVCACVVIKSGRNPALDAVALCATGLPYFSELIAVRFHVAILADLRSSLKLRLVGPTWSFVACAACHGTMRTKERELGF